MYFTCIILIRNLRSFLTLVRNKLQCNNKAKAKLQITPCLFYSALHLMHETIMTDPK